MGLVYCICVGQECSEASLALGEEKREYRKFCLISRVLSRLFPPKTRFSWPKLVLLMTQTCLRFTSVSSPCCEIGITKVGVQTLGGSEVPGNRVLAPGHVPRSEWSRAMGEVLGNTRDVSSLAPGALAGEGSSCDQGTRPGVRRWRCCRAGVAAGVRSPDTSGGTGTLGCAGHLLPRWIWGSLGWSCWVTTQGIQQNNVSDGLCCDGAKEHLVALG